MGGPVREVSPALLVRRASTDRPCTLLSLWFENKSAKSRAECLHALAGCSSLRLLPSSHSTVPSCCASLCHLITSKQSHVLGALSPQLPRWLSGVQDTRNTMHKCAPGHPRASIASCRDPCSCAATKPEKAMPQSSCMQSRCVRALKFCPCTCVFSEPLS